MEIFTFVILALLGIFFGLLAILAQGAMVVFIASLMNSFPSPQKKLLWFKPLAMIWVVIILIGVTLATILPSLNPGALILCIYLILAYMGSRKKIRQKLKEAGYHRLNLLMLSLGTAYNILIFFSGLLFYFLISFTE